MPSAGSSAFSASTSLPRILFTSSSGTPFAIAQCVWPHWQRRQSVTEVTPSMIFSRSAGEIFGLNSALTRTGPDARTLPTVLRKLPGGSVRFIFPGCVGGGLVPLFGC